MERIASQSAADASTDPGSEKDHDEGSEVAEYEVMAKKLNNSKIKRLLAKLRPRQVELEKKDPEF
jgi:hypothetical protein